ncbi:MAG TPA: hypothetical protein HPQ04_09385 [Rhodospirillaceae bacterium]|nr:hypothetical protein [Rhodospirillaceae bacterium]
MIFCCVICLSLPTAAARAAQSSAADLLDAKVDYAADYYLNAEKGSFQGTVIHAPGRERREFESAGGHQVLLLRRDIDEASILWSDRKWYVSTSFQALAALVGGFDGILLDRKAVGQETVGGEKTTCYEVTTDDKASGGFKGRMWFSRDGILMKAKGKAQFNGRDTVVDTGLLNLRRLKADPAAFVRPPDYKGLPLDLAKLGLVP